MGRAAGGVGDGGRCLDGGGEVRARPVALKGRRIIIDLVFVLPDGLYDNQLKFFLGVLGGFIGEVDADGEGNGASAVGLSLRVDALDAKGVLDDEAFVGVGGLNPKEGCGVGIVGGGIMLRCGCGQEDAAVLVGGKGAGAGGFAKGVASAGDGGGGGEGVVRVCVPEATAAGVRERLGDLCIRLVGRLVGAEGFGNRWDRSGRSSGTKECTACLGDGGDIKGGAGGGGIEFPGGGRGEGGDVRAIGDAVDAAALDGDGCGGALHGGVVFFCGEVDDRGARDDEL